MKRNYLKYLLFIFLIFLSFNHSVNALTGTVNVNDSLTLRSTPSTSGSVITKFYNATILTILDTNAGSGNGCSGNWYKVSYGDYTGYSCGDYIILASTSTNSSEEDDSYSSSNYSTTSGDGTIMCYEDTTDLTLKKTAGGSSNGISVSCGESVTINSVTETNDGYWWYNVTTSKGTGYVNNIYVNTTVLSSTAESYYKSNSNGDTKESYTAKLKEAGFPTSYINYLLELHARYPNWNFVAESIDIDFDDAVDGESGNGASLLEGSAFDEGYRSLNSHTYDILTDTWYEYSGEAGYYNASKEAIAYYMDPRNYLNQKYIFAFETLEYSSNQSTSVVSSIISNQSFFNSIYSQTWIDGTNSASGDIVSASSSANISAVHVASRIKQEMGTSLTTSDSRLGGTFTYNSTSYSGYYNFFNIKSSCSNCSSIYAAYAYLNGWNTPYKGILGGATFLAKNYISLNQDTLYYEKFDVSTDDGDYTHQYMQNLAAVAQESGSTYKGYLSSMKSYLDTAITFVIPVYNNMPENAVTAPKIGNPNNYLKNLTVNGSAINGFSYDTYNYNIYLTSGTSSVTVSASTINSNASVSGTGTIKITSDNQTNQIIVTAQNGKTRVYTINFIREEDTSNSSNDDTSTDTNTSTDSTTSGSTNSSTSENTDSSSNNTTDSSTTVTATVSETMNNSGFKYNSSYMFGIAVGTNVSSLIGNISNYNHYVSVSIKDSSGNSKTNASFKTGDTITVTGSDGTKTYTAVIYGDTNGDGKISAVDYVAIKNHIMNTKSLTGAYLEAADVNKDGKVSAVDYVMIKNQIMGTSTISQ